MSTNGILYKHWFSVAMNFALDACLVLLGFVAAAFLRFGEEADLPLWIHWPSFLVGAVSFGATNYITGLYAPQSTHRGVFERAVILVGSTVLTSLVIISASYIGVARPLGRGVMLIGSTVAFLFAFIHQILLLHSMRVMRQRVAYIVSSAFDEAETRLFDTFRSHNFELLGVIAACKYEPCGNVPMLGSIQDVEQIVREHRVDRVLCTHKNLNNATLTRHFCQLRYSGVSVMPLIILCEEVQQQVPLELVTHEWLLSASGEPQLLYIKKIKRLFDIVASSTGLIFGAPLVAIAAVLIKLTSPGPVLYRQTRAGRFGRNFSMTKLRTMQVDAEKAGAQWSAKDASHDPRVTFVGRFLRRYRIDEIPQLWHVLSGDMSFVGPRPERPEMIDQLAKEIPFYQERLMIQPGITGWAQVNYPYGASMLDARRKLEYDLYYMKHMSWFLDVFILLDTVRIILTGGVQAHAAKSLAHSEALREWQRLKPTDPVTDESEAESAIAANLKPV